MALVNGIITAIIKAGKENKDFIAKKTKDFEKAKAAAEACTPDAVAKVAGIDADVVTKAAEMFAAAPARSSRHVRRRRLRRPDPGPCKPPARHRQCR